MTDGPYEPILLPQSITEIIESWDSRPDLFSNDQLANAIQARWKALGEIDDATREAIRVEYCSHRYREGTGGEETSPWGTYFCPEISWTDKDGKCIYGPDLSATTEAVVNHWKYRAQTLKHPVLISRYSDLIWDVSGGLKIGKREIKYAKCAQEAYAAAVDRFDSRADKDSDPNADNETRHQRLYCHRAIERAVWISLKISDKAAIHASMTRCIDFIETNYEINLPCTYVWGFDTILAGPRLKKCPEEIKHRTIKFFKDIFARMSEGEEWSRKPHQVYDVAKRLATLEKGSGKPQIVAEIMTVAARSFERHARLGLGALHAIHFLEIAESIYLSVGMHAERDRVRAEVERIAPEVKKEMSPVKFEIKIEKEEIELFEQELSRRDIDEAMSWLAMQHIITRKRLEQHLEEMKEVAPIQALVGKSVVGNSGTVADIRDADGDVDGNLVYELALRLEFNLHWFERGIDLLKSRGLGVQSVVDYLFRSPFFDPERKVLVEMGLREIFEERFPQAIHLLVPQIEHSIIRSLKLKNGPTTRMQNGGRSRTAQRGLAEALYDPLMLDIFGDDVKLHLIATLAHPKGLNIRNLVAHGMCGESYFNNRNAMHLLQVVLLLGVPGQRMPPEEVGK